MHEDFLQDLRKLYSAIQLYQTHWGEYVQAESKLKQAEKQVRFPLTELFVYKIISCLFFFLA